MIRYLWHLLRGHDCYRQSRRYWQRYRCRTCARPCRDDPAWTTPLQWGPKGRPA